MKLADTLSNLLGELDWRAQLHDSWMQGAAPRQAPSVDLAVCLFQPGQAPQAGNVLLSREGLVKARLPAHFGAAEGIAFQADVRDTELNSVAWLPDADWSHIAFPPLHGEGWRFVAPYPASLLKLMLAAGVTHWLDTQGGSIDQAWSHDGDERCLRSWQHDMLALSCNRATDALVAWGHAVGLLPGALPELLRNLGLPTLRFEHTTPRGGWRNADGAGVGAIQMTAWDALRLVWWLDPTLPPCAWTDLPRLRDSSALWTALAGQQLPGLIRRPGFAHKTGNTDNYSADAGRWDLGQGRVALVAVTSSLGKRFAEGDPGGFAPALVKLGERLACQLEAA
ncbi:hypothetical protein [Inhella sp.]|uniref:hypothetical protein n=1 Tax=Inhella sp. TaxID=1921806 RepID=UPI0035B1124F